MFSYAVSSTRQRFLARFEPHREDYLYRRTDAAVSVRISSKDHKFMVDEFDFSWLHFPYVAAFAIACAALFIWMSASQISSSTNQFLSEMGIPISALWFVGAWYADLWDIPNRALFQRARDMGSIAPLPWLTKSAGDMSWRSTTVFVFWGPQVSYRALANESADFWDNFFFGFLILGATLTLLAAVRKVQLNWARSLPYLNEVD